MKFQLWILTVQVYSLFCTLLLIPNILSYIWNHTGMPEIDSFVLNNEVKDEGQLNFYKWDNLEDI